MNLTDPNSQKTTKSITNVAPNASAGDIKAFAVGMNALTSNTLDSITKVDKTSIDTTRQYEDPVLTITKDNDSNNAVTIDGNIITVDFTKTVNSLDISQQTYVIIKNEYATLESMGDKFNVEFEPVQSGGHVGSISISPDTEGIMLSFMHLDSNNTQNLTITFAGTRKLNTNTYFNPVTVEIRKAV